ncbi:MAG: BNR-4 repeat-containing protein, partial [Candidatus Eisenbacteria bacterium]|nr:BNR-4 repeat-containing protein [Candidatus Eisenbacteria bacterium]
MRYQKRQRVDRYCVVLIGALSTVLALSALEASGTVPDARPVGTVPEARPAGTAPEARPAGTAPEAAPLELSPDGAWCWFADPRAITHEGEHRRTYLGWVTSRGDIQVGSYDHGTGRVEISTVRERFQQNDHASPALAVRPDGRLIVFYSSHRGDRVYYRESLEPENVASWGEEQMTGAWIDGAGGYTYPNVLSFCGGQAGMLLFFRGPSYQPSVLTQNEAGQWDRGRVLVEGRGERPYIKFEADGSGSIHLAFTYGHPRLESENSICYARLATDGFFRADGTRVAEAAEALPWDLADVAYDGGSGDGPAWIWDIAVDADGRPVIVYAVFPEETDHRYRYARWDGRAWRDHEMVRAGSWFPRVVEGEDRFEPHYSGGIALDHGDPSVVYVSRPLDGVFEIERWETGDGGATWDSTPVTVGSDADNVRPCVPRGHGDDGPQVLWMRGDYRDYADYHTSIIAAVSRSASSPSSRVEAPGAAPSSSLSSRTAAAMKRAFIWQKEAFDREDVGP